MLAPGGDGMVGRGTSRHYDCSTQAAMNAGLESLTGEHLIKRILHITRTLEVGGMEEVVATLCRTVDPAQFESSVLCLRGEGPLAEELRADQVPVVSLDSDPARPDYLASLKVARVLRDVRPDVIHTHNTTALLFGVSGALLARVPWVVHTDHSRVYPERPHIRLAERFMSRWVDRFVAVSDQTADDLDRHLGISRNRILTVENGIEGARYRVRIDRAAKRSEFGFPADAFVAGVAARLVSQKGLDVLLEALHQLRSRCPMLHVALAGTGDVEQELREQAARLDIADRVHFLGLRRDVPDFLHSIDAYVLPSLWEGLPMGLLEAMAAARPIVASAVGGVGVAINHEVSGLLVDRGRPDELANQLERLVNDPLLANDLGAEAARVFDDKYSADAMASRYQSFYDRSA